VIGHGATDTLGCLSREAKSESVRLYAARSVLELGVKLRESVELEERLSALEAAREASSRKGIA
jgi:hypothetical protein